MMRRPTNSVMRLMKEEFTPEVESKGLEKDIMFMQDRECHHTGACKCVIDSKSQFIIG